MLTVSSLLIRHYYYTLGSFLKPFQNGIILRRRRRRLSNQPKRNDEYIFCKDIKTALTIYFEYINV